MADKSKLSEEASRGAHAKRLRDDPMIMEFFETVEQVAIQTIRKSAPDQSDLRERAYFQLEALENLKLCFQKVINDGAFAQHELKNLEERKE